MKTFLGIGSGAGMGLATAERFAREGFRVILSGRDVAKVEGLAARLTAKGFTAEARGVEAGVSSSVSGLIDEVRGTFGGIDVVHYNAAAMRQATLADQPRDTFNGDLAVNIGGALAAAQAASVGMVERGSGTILLTGGGFALQPSPDFLSLSIGKAGIRALAQGLFEPMRDKGVHVASVTVTAQVEPGSKEAAEVADLFWQLYTQPKDRWCSEIQYAPAS